MDGKPGGVPKSGGGWSGGTGPRMVKLREFALARSGDKGDGSNVGIFVRTDADYALIRRVLTPERVKQLTTSLPSLKGVAALRVQAASEGEAPALLTRKKRA